MAMMPSRVKYRKAQRGSRTGTAWRGATVAFGEYGLQALERAWVTTTQHEASREIVDSRVPGQADYQAASRDTNGEGQGPAGNVGGGDTAWKCIIRIGRGDGVAGAGI